MTPITRFISPGILKSELTNYKKFRIVIPELPPYRLIVSVEFDQAYVVNSAHPYISLKNSCSEIQLCCIQSIEKLPCDFAPLSLFPSSQCKQYQWYNINCHISCESAVQPAIINMQLACEK